MISSIGIRISKQVKSFLELAQPLPVKYGYQRGVRQGDGFVTYRDIGSTIESAVGGRLISERRSYMITVQTKTAEQNLLYSYMIKLASDGSYVTIVSEDLRKDLTVEDGWINSLVVTVYNATLSDEIVLSAQDAGDLLQEAIRIYMLATKMFASASQAEAASRLAVPELNKQQYTYAEVIKMKHEAIDALVI